MRESPALRLRQTVYINTAEAVHDTDVTGLREERVPINEAPQRDQRVDAARLAVVTEDAPDPYHRTISTSNRSCFPGS